MYADNPSSVSSLELYGRRSDTRIRKCWHSSFIPGDELKSDDGNADDEKPPGHDSSQLEYSINSLKFKTAISNRCNYPAHINLI